MANTTVNLPIISNEAVSLFNVDKKFPMLDAEEEYMLAKNWRSTEI